MSLFRNITSLLLLMLLLSGCYEPPSTNITVPIQATQEKSALLSLRELHAAQQHHLAQLGSYASSLNALVSSGALQGGLADGEKSGYRFSVLAATASSFQLIAEPIEFGKTGRRRYYTDQSGVIRFSKDANQALDTSLPAVQ